MNKSISIGGFVCAAFTSLCIGTSAIAIPINMELANNNSILHNGNEMAFKGSNNESKDSLNKVIFFIGLIGTGAIFWSIFQSRKGTKSNFQPIKSQSNTALLDRVNPKLRRQLLRLINDPKTANRLLMGIYKNNSDRSPNWLAEKAIYDLRRGR